MLQTPLFTGTGVAEVDPKDRKSSGSLGKAATLDKSGSIPSGASSKRGVAKTKGFNKDVSSAKSGLKDDRYKGLVMTSSNSTAAKAKRLTQETDTKTAQEAMEGLADLAYDLTRIYKGKLTLRLNEISNFNYVDYLHCIK
jgi:hypothetical protein